MTPTRPCSGEVCRTCWMLIVFFFLCCLSSSASSSFSSRQLINKGTSSRVVTHLPGFDGPLPFHLQTGYVEVDEGNGIRLFYYFVRSERSPTDDPLMLWLTGGPGCSVLTGLAYEIGPLSFDVNGDDADGLPKLLYRTDTWTKVSSIIFLDSPVGAGFSYSVTEQGYRSSDTKAVDQIFIFLRKWLDEHPEFQSNPLYIGGDSYAGMIVPTVASRIARGIEVGREPVLNLKGYLVGNPVTDSNFDGPSKIPFAHGKGLISDELYETYRKSCGTGGGNAGPVWNRLVSASIGIEHITPQAAFYGIKSPMEALSNKVTPNGDSSYPSIECAVSLYTIDECLRGICPNHILEPLCAFASPHPDTTTDAEPRLSEITLQCRTAGYLMSKTWANNGSVREALGIHKGTIPSWIRCNYGLPYTADIPSSVKYHLDVTTRGYRSLVYSGDHDMVIPFIGTQAWIKSLGFSVVDKWRPWYVDGQVAGFTRSYANNLTFATVKGGGHTAPEYMPRQCFEMFERWISGGPL